MRLPLKHVYPTIYYKKTNSLSRPLITTINDLFFYKKINIVHFDTDNLTEGEKQKILHTKLCTYNYNCSNPNCRYIHFYQKYYDEIIIYTNRVKLRRTIAFRKNYEKIYTLFLYKYKLKIPLEVLKKIFSFVVEDGNELLECKYGLNCRAKYCMAYHKCEICNEYFTNSKSRASHKCKVSYDLDFNIINLSGCKFCIRHINKYRYICKNKNCFGIHRNYQDTYKCFCCNYKTKNLTYIHRHYNNNINCFRNLPSYLKIKLKIKIDEYIRNFVLSRFNFDINEHKSLNCHNNKMQYKTLNLILHGTNIYQKTIDKKLIPRTLDALLDKSYNDRICKLYNNVRDQVSKYLIFNTINDNILNSINKNFCWKFLNICKINCQVRILKTEYVDNIRINYYDYNQYNFLIDYYYLYFKKLSKNNNIGTLTNYYEISFKNLIKFIGNFNKKKEYNFSNTSDILFSSITIYNKIIYKKNLNNLDYLIDEDFRYKINKIFRELLEYLEEIKPIIMYKDKLHSINNIFEQNYYDKLKRILLNNDSYYYYKNIYNDNITINYTIFNNNLLDVNFYYYQYLHNRKKNVDEFIKMNHNSEYTKIIKHS